MVAVNLLHGTASIGAAAALSLANRIRSLRTGLGERSVVEAFQGRLATADELHHVLSGRNCPHQQSNCIFLQSEGQCGISGSAVEAILTHLENAQLVEHLTMMDEGYWRFTG